MSPAECLRDLISERLTAAAEEIFSVFQRTIEQYEEEIHRQRRLLEIFMKPELKLHRADFPQLHVCKEEDVLTDQQLCNLDQNDPKAQIKEEKEELCTGLDRKYAQIKEEQDEFYTSLEGEQLVLKQATETFMWTSTCQESDTSDNQTMELSFDETQSAANDQYVVNMSVKGSIEPDALLLSNNFHVIESQDHKGGEQGDLGSTINAGSRSQKGRQKSKSHIDNENNSTTLTIHSSTYRGKQSFQCDICGKDFTYKCNLRRHLRVHTGERPFPCNICEKRFSLLDRLKNHMMIHTGEKPHSCNICEKRFSQPAALKEHMRTHTGEKPYQCNTCEKRFSHTETLKKHMRVHTGEKPYLCNTCERSFSQLGALKKHLRVHTGEKPYPCNTCGKRFSQLGALKNHTRIHTGEKPYHCQTCGRDFRLRYQLNDHLKMHTAGRDSVTCQA